MYAMVDFICMGLFELQGPRSENNKVNKHTENIAKSNTGPPPAPTNSDLQPIFRRTFS